MNIKHHTSHIGLKIIALFLIIAIYLALRQQSTSWIEWIRHSGHLSVVFFFIIYCACALLWLPTTPLIFAGGAIYGIYSGTILNLTCATTSALLSFLLSRHLGIDWLPKRSQHRLNHWIQTVQAYGWKSLAFCRLMPFVPCAIVNYGFGLTQIRTLPFVLTSFLFFIPLKIVQTYCGYISI